MPKSDKLMLVQATAGLALQHQETNRRIDQIQHEEEELIIAAKDKGVEGTFLTTSDALEVRDCVGLAKSFPEANRSHCLGTFSLDPIDIASYRGLPNLCRACLKTRKLYVKRHPDDPATIAFLAKKERFKKQKTAPEGAAGPGTAEQQDAIAFGSDA